MYASYSTPCNVMPYHESTAATQSIFVDHLSDDPLSLSRICAAYLSLRVHPVMYPSHFISFYSCRGSDHI